jgi:hypothetical protein
VTWHELVDEIDAKRKDIKNLEEQLAKVRDACTHPNLPKHEPFEEFGDTCPDCGFFAYRMRLL